MTAAPGAGADKGHDRDADDDPDEDAFDEWVDSRPGPVVEQRPAIPDAAPWQVVLPAQAFDRRPDQLTAVVLAGIGPQARLYERRFGPDLEAEGLYAPLFDVRDIATSAPPATLVPVAAAAEASLGWVVWTDAQGLYASPRRLLHEVASLALPAAGRQVLTAIETADHGLLVHVLVSEPVNELGPSARAPGTLTQVLACRFEAPVEQVEPADPNDPDDWDDTELVLGPAACIRLGGFAGQPVAPCALVPSRAGPAGGETARMLVPVEQGGELDLLHLALTAQACRVTGRVGLGRVLLPAGNPMALCIDAAGDSQAAVLVLQQAAQSTGLPGSQPLWQARLLRPSWPGDNAELQQAPVLGEWDAPPAQGSVGFSWLAPEQPFWRVALLTPDGPAGDRLWLSDPQGRLQALPLPEPALQPPTLLVGRHASYLVVRPGVSAGSAGSGPLLCAVLHG